MNFNLVDGDYVDFESIHDDFVQDYLFDNALSSDDLRKKYDLTIREFWRFAREVREEYGITRRPKRGLSECKYYYPVNQGFKVAKMIDGKSKYFGYFKSEEIAKIFVEVCKKKEWDIDVCRGIYETWRSKVF